MHLARRTGAALAVAAIVAATAIIHQAAPAAANTTIGWVLDASGSVHCYVASGTNNHVICDTYWPGSGGIKTAAQIDDWLPYACMGGAYMVSGDNAGNPAQLIYQNAPGYYCGRVPGGPLSFRVGYCTTGAHWNEGTFDNTPGLPYMTQAGNMWSVNYAGSNWNQSWPTWPYATCVDVGHSRVGHIIYH